MSDLSVCLNEALASLIYTILARLEVSLHWQGRLLLLGGYSRASLIYYGPEFLFSLLQLMFDQSTKGDLVN
jgi:hypothetical protein